MYTFACHLSDFLIKIMNTFTNIIAKELQLPASGVDGTLQLLDEGCTIPFIARYRKERTGGLDDVQIGDIVWSAAA